MNVFYVIVVVVLIILARVMVEIRREEQREKEAQREEGLTIHKFACLVAKKEGKKKQVNIAQIKEILKVVNGLLGGELYNLIKTGKRPNAKKTKNNKCC